MPSLTSAQIRTFALDLATSPAWNLLVRPEIDRQIQGYEDTILNAPDLPDRELADTRTKYHALQRLLKDLRTTVSGSFTEMSAEESALLTPETYAQITGVFDLHQKSGGTHPIPQPPQQNLSQISFPPSPVFNPFSSPPPPENT